MEIVYHSVHYVDLIRSFLGDPRSVHARTVSHPLYPKLASVRSAILMDYPDPVRATITTNHLPPFRREAPGKLPEMGGHARGDPGPRRPADELPARRRRSVSNICLLEDGKPGEWQSVRWKARGFPRRSSAPWRRSCHKEGS